MADCLRVLFDGFLKVALLVQFVSVLFADFSDDVVWEAGVAGDLLGLVEQELLHQRVDLDVVLHLVEFAENNRVVRVRGQIINSVFLNLHLQDSRV